MIPEATSRPDEVAHPVWRLLAARVAIRADDAVPPAAIVCRLPDPARPWRLALEEARRGVPAGSLLLVMWDRAVPRAVLGILARRRVQVPRTPSVGALVRALRERDLEVRGRYVIWPSVGAPRVALQVGSYAALRWVQRSGVLGGGGRSLVLRAAARSFLFTPFAFFLAPGIVLVARVTDRSAVQG